MSSRTFLAKNSSYIASLVAFINDTKPYRCKITEIVEEFQLVDTARVAFTEQLFTRTKIDSTCLYSDFSSANPLYRTFPAHRAESPELNTRAYLVGTDENTDLALVPFVYSKKSFDGIGVNQVIIERAAGSEEALTESVDYFQSHGSMQFQIKRTANAFGVNDPAWSITPDDGLITQATGTTRELALDTANPSSTVNRLRALLNTVQAASTAAGGDPDVQRELNALYGILAVPDLPGSYEALLGWLAASENEILIDRQALEQQLDELTSPLYFGKFSDLGSYESGLLSYADIANAYLSVTGIVGDDVLGCEEWTLTSVDASTYAVAGSASGFAGFVVAGHAFSTARISFGTAFVSAAPVGRTLVLTPTNKIVIARTAPLETWNLIKVNPIAHDRPMYASTRYGRIRDLSGVLGSATLLDPALPTGTIILIVQADGVHVALSSTADPAYAGTAVVGVLFNDGRLGFTLDGPFLPNDRLYIDVQNDLVQVLDLDLGYGYDLDPYDNGHLVYENTDPSSPQHNQPVGFYYDGRFPEYDLAALGLTVDEVAVSGRAWRLRAVPGLTTPIATLKKDGSGPSPSVDFADSTSGTSPDPALHGVPVYSMAGDGTVDLTLFYAEQFAVEYSDDDFRTSTTVGTSTVGTAFDSAEHGLHFTIAPASRPFVAVQATTAARPTVLFMDTFAGVDGTLITAHAPDTAPAGGWVIDTSGGVAASHLSLLGGRLVTSGPVDTGHTLRVTYDATFSPTLPYRVGFKACVEAGQGGVGIIIGVRNTDVEQPNLIYVDLAEDFADCSVVGPDLTATGDGVSVTTGAEHELAVTVDDTGFTFTVDGVPRAHQACTVPMTLISVNLYKGVGTSVGTYIKEISLTVPAELAAPVEGGDVFSFRVHNAPPRLTEPIGLVAPYGPRLIMHSDSFYAAPDAAWRVTIGDGMYTVSNSLGASFVSSIGTPGGAAREGLSFRGGGVQFTIVPNSGFFPGDVFTFNTFGTKPSYLVHGSVTGYTAPAVVGRYYWNEKIGFKLTPPTGSVFVDGALVDPASVGLSFALREDCPTLQYTFARTTAGYLVSRSDVGVVGFVPSTGTFGDLYLQVSTLNTTAPRIQLLVREHGFPLWNTADTVILHPSVAARLPSTGDAVHVQKNRDARLALSITPGLADLTPLGQTTIDQRFIGTDTNSSIPLSATSPDTAVLQGWLPLTDTRLDSDTSVAEFSDPVTQHLLISATTNEPIGSLVALTANLNEPVVFRWDPAFLARYLPLNSEANLVVTGTGWNELIRVRTNESLKILIDGGPLAEDWMFQDAVTTSVVDSTDVALTTSFTDGSAIIVSDGPFVGFAAGYDTLRYEDELGDQHVLPAENDFTGGAYDAGRPPDLASLLAGAGLTAQQTQDALDQWNNFLLDGRPPTTAEQYAYLLAALDPPSDLLTTQGGDGLQLQDGEPLELNAPSDLLTTQGGDGLQLQDGEPLELNAHASEDSAVGLGFGLPLVGLGIDALECPSTQATTGFSETFVMVVADFSTLHDVDPFDAGALDAEADVTAALQTRSLPPIPVSYTAGGTYDEFDTPLAVATPARVFEVTFNLPADELLGLSPTFSVWLPTAAAPVQVPVVERVTSNMFRFSLAAASAAKIIVA